MEQQKILWIILSVAVLLLAVLGTALFIFTPSSASGSTDSMASAGVLSTSSFDPVEWARSRGEYPGVVDRITDESEGEFVVVYGESSEELEKQEEENAGKEESVVIVAVPQPKTAPAPVKTAPAQAVKKAAPATAPAPAQAVKQVTEYWIQAGSFTSLNRAETAKSALVSKGLSAAIQTKTVDTQVFYRVRTGPYSSKEEAEKFLFWIKDIEGFIQSYVSQVQALR